MEKGTFYWPPRGWKQLGNISRPEGQAIAKDIKTARIYGLSYTIRTDRIFDGRQDVNRYGVSLDAWEYSILNESKEYPVLSFDLTDRLDLLKPREHYISGIKVLARPIRDDRMTARRAMTAAVFLIRQIELGLVPDVDRVLSIYRLRDDVETPFKMTPFSVAKAPALTKSWKS
jgi:hypothetical protein